MCAPTPRDRSSAWLRLRRISVSSSVKTERSSSLGGMLISTLNCASSVWKAASAIASRTGALHEGRVARVVGQVQLDLEPERALLGIEARLPEHAREHVEAGAHLRAVALPVLTAEYPGGDFLSHVPRLPGNGGGFPSRGSGSQAGWTCKSSSRSTSQTSTRSRSRRSSRCWWPPHGTRSGAGARVPRAPRRDARAGAARTRATVRARRRPVAGEGPGRPRRRHRDGAVRTRPAGHAGQARGARLLLRAHGDGGLRPGGAGGRAGRRQRHG